MSNSRYWRKRAARVRRYAAEMTDPESEQANLNWLTATNFSPNGLTSEQKRTSFKASNRRRDPALFYR
jgi:hypothetical protein